MAAWVWMWDGSRDGDENTHYQPYSEKDSQLLEENFEASGFKATTALSLNGRKYIIRKTRKGWVQEVDGQPQFWRAVKRVQRHSAPPSSPSPNSIAPPAAASPNFELSQLRLEREARQRAAASSTTSPAVASSPAASPPPSATLQHQPLLLPLPNKSHQFRLRTVRTTPSAYPPSFKVVRQSVCRGLGLH